MIVAGESIVAQMGKGDIVVMRCSVRLVEVRVEVVGKSNGVACVVDYVPKENTSTCEKGRV